MKKIVNTFTSLAREVQIAKGILNAATAVALIKLAWVSLHGKDGDIAAYAAAVAALLAALAVVLIADRQVVFESMLFTQEQQQAKVRGMHEMVFLAKDLKGMLSHAQGVLRRGGGHISVFAIHENIRTRFEKMCADHMFAWLPGDCIDRLSNISPLVYGACNFLAEAERVSRASQITTVPKSDKTADLIEKAKVEIQEFIDRVGELRNELAV